MPDVWIHTVTVAARDPELLARFWAALLAYEVAPNHSSSVQLADPTGAGPTLLFAPSDDTGSGRDRFHLDLRPLDQRSTVARALDLGASILPTRDGASWIRMADPEGNRFCVLQSQSDHRDYLKEHGPGSPTITSGA